MVLKVLSLSLGIFAIISSLMPLIKAQMWWIRMFDFPRVQVGFLLALSLVLCLLTGCKEIDEKIYMMILSGALIFQSIRILPYTFITRNEVKSAKKIKEDSKLSILVVNVYMNNNESEKCINLIKKVNADIVLTLETNKWWQERLNIIEKDYPYCIHVPLENTYGLMLYSRLKLIDPHIRYLIKNDIPSVKTKIELPSGQHVLFYGVHPKPPSPGESETSEERDTELLVIGKEVKKEQTLPVIVAGDLNDVAWSHTTHLFQRISGLLDPRKGRGMYSTYNAKSIFWRWPLDHVFHSSHFKLIKMKRHEKIGSDHFPICISLSYEPEDKHEQKKREPTKGEKKEAEEKLGRKER
jgi:endonuclease/exonuclease/phosphatase (EEP) superfamily protein YafD